jgi:hypothetical protein
MAGADDQQIVLGKGVLSAKARERVSASNSAAGIGVQMNSNPVSVLADPYTLR